MVYDLWSMTYGLCIGPHAKQVGIAQVKPVIALGIAIPGKLGASLIELKQDLTLVGAPKVRAMQLIDELEPVGRGVYAGTVGYFGNGGDMDHAIAIRTLVFSEGEYSYQAGAGIVADSVPLNEYNEVLAKSAILRRALEIAEQGL